MATYVCKRCNNYNTTKFSDIKKHINRKYQCKISNCSLLLSTDQRLVLSLYPLNTNSINISDIEHLKNSECIYNNKKELFDELDNIDNDTIKTCKYCENDFDNRLNLKKHIIFNCFHKYLESKTDKNIIITNNSHNKTINSNNTTNITNNNIQINLDVNSEKPVSFYSDWDISHIDDNERTKILVSRFMYTHLLEAILKNDINLNVIIDKDNKKTGLIYKDNTSQYCTMKMTDIADKTMEKLHNHIKNIREENTDTIGEIITHSRRIADKKFIDYTKDDDLKFNVQHRLLDEYIKINIKAVTVAKKITKDTDEIEY